MINIGLCVQQLVDKKKFLVNDIMFHRYGVKQCATIIDVM
jgi:hypothetical protein